MDPQRTRLEAALGVAVGPLTCTLFDLADAIGFPSPSPIGTISSGSPIWRCDFYVDFPAPFPTITPSNVVLFGSTGVDGNQFGFVKPLHPRGTTDDLAVCLVRPKGGDPVLAPNLVAFLSLVATAGTEAIDIDMTDADFADARARALEDAGFREASALLCTLPGVMVPTAPAAILRACPEVALEIEAPPSAPAVISLDAARSLLDQGKRDAAAHVLVHLVDKWLDLDDLVPKANWEALGALLGVGQPSLGEARRAALQRHGISF